MGDNLGVVAAVELQAPQCQLFLQIYGVDDIAVVRQREVHGGADRAYRLGVVDDTAAGGGVARVADGDVAGQLSDVLFLERLPYKPHRHLDVDAVARAGGYARALLSTVLEGVESEEGMPRDILAFRINADDAASLSRVVVLRGSDRIWMPRDVAVHSQLRSMFRFQSVGVDVQYQYKARAVAKSMRYVGKNGLIRTDGVQSSVSCRGVCYTVSDCNAIMLL